MRVASFASLSGKALTQDNVEHLLKDILQEEARRSVTVDQIQRKRRRALRHSAWPT